MNCCLSLYSLRIRERVIIFLKRLIARSMLSLSLTFTPIIQLSGLKSVFIEGLVTLNNFVTAKKFKERIHYFLKLKHESLILGTNTIFLFDPHSTTRCSNSFLFHDFFAIQSQVEHNRIVQDHQDSTI